MLTTKYTLRITFNSLSRDHREFLNKLRTVDSGGALLSTPSLGITAFRTSGSGEDCSRQNAFQLPLSGSLQQLANEEHALTTFNSLSRDHVVIGNPPTADAASVGFQLPLSGSHEEGCHERPGQVPGFQLPLSGSLKVILSDVSPALKNPFNSLSRDH